MEKNVLREAQTNQGPGRVQPSECVVSSRNMLCEKNPRKLSGGVNNLKQIVEPKAALREVTPLILNLKIPYPHIYSIQ